MMGRRQRGGNSLFWRKADFGSKEAPGVGREVLGQFFLRSLSSPGQTSDSLKQGN